MANSSATGRCTLNGSCFRKASIPTKCSEFSPSAAVYYTLGWFHIPRTIPNVIAAFNLLNLFLLIGTAVVWQGIARTVGLSRDGAGGGCCSYSAATSALKWAGYYPVLTDVSRVLFRNRPVLRLSDAAGLAAGCRDAGGPGRGPSVCTPAFCCWLSETDAGAGDGSPGRLRWANWTALAVTAGFLAVSAHLMFHIPTWKPCDTVPALFDDIHWPCSAISPWYWYVFSAAVAAIYLFAGLRVFFREFDVWSKLGRRYLLSANVLAAGLVWGGVQIGITALAVGGTPLGMSHRILLTAYTANQNPGVFFVSHFLFFGPIAAIAAFHWRGVVRTAANWATAWRSAWALVS